MYKYYIKWLVSKNEILSCTETVCIPTYEQSVIRPTVKYLNQKTKKKKNGFISNSHVVMI